MTSFSRMRISVAVNGSSSSMESVLNVGLYFEKMGFYSQCHIKTCLYSLIYIQNILGTALPVSNSCQDSPNMTTTPFCFLSIF